jgi:steroid 5-alpha reductase family enzyme
MGIMVPTFNTVFNSANSLIFTASPPAQFFPYQLYVGAAMYTVGILIEAISEVQRKTFKDRPENQGKAYGSGLFREFTLLPYLYKSIAS